MSIIIIQTGDSAQCHRPNRTKEIDFPRHCNRLDGGCGIEDLWPFDYYYCYKLISYKYISCNVTFPYDSPHHFAPRFAYLNNDTISGTYIT